MRSLAFKQFVQTLPLINLYQLATGIQESFAQTVKDGLPIRNNQFMMQPAALYLLSQHLTSLIAHSLVETVTLYNTVEELSPVEREMSVASDNLISQRVHQYMAPEYPLITRMFKVMRLEVPQSNISLASDVIVHDNPERVFYAYLKRNAELFQDTLVPMISAKYCKLLTREHVTRGFKFSSSYEIREPNKEHFKVPILDPSENWILISLFGLPYQYEILQYVRYELLRHLNDKGVPISGVNASDNFLHFLDQQQQSQDINIHPLPNTSHLNVYGSATLIPLMEYWRHMVFLTCVVSKYWLKEGEKDLYEILPIPMVIDGINVVETFGQDAEMIFRHGQGQRK